MMARRILTAAAVAAMVMFCAVHPAGAGLVNYWTMEEGAGTTTADIVGGQSADWTANAGEHPAWTNSNLPPVPTGTTQALVFDSSDRLVVYGYLGISGTNPRSVSAWVQPTSTNRPIVTWGTNSGGQKWVIRNDNASGALRVEVNGGYQIGEVDLNDGQWHHTVVTLADGGANTNVTDARLWVDGQLQGISSSQGKQINTAAGQNVRMGRDFNNRSFLGTMDEVRIYDSAIDRSEVRALAGLAPDTYFETVKAAGPVGYWRLGEAVGTKAFNEGSLGAAADGTYNNAPTLGEPGAVSGTDNASATFNGTNQYVEATGYKGITGKDPRTVSAWIKTDDSGNGPIVSWGTNTAGDKWNFRVQDSNGPAGTVRVEVNGGYQVGSTFVADGQWHHVAATWEDDGTSPNVNDVRLWVDGVLQGVGASQGQAITTATSGTDVRIGRGIPTDDYFHGGLDEVQIYDRALSRSEIGALATVAPDPYFEAVKADNPITYWRLGEEAGNKAFNEGSLGSAVDGTYQNGPDLARPGLVPNSDNLSAHFRGGIGGSANDNQVNIPDNDAISGSGGYDKKSIEAWFVADSHTTTTNRRVIYEQGGTTEGLNLYVQRESGDDTYYIRAGAWLNDGTQTNNFPSRVQIQPGETNHVTSVYDVNDQSFVMYVNGVPVSAKTGSDIRTIGDHDSDTAIGAKRDATRFDNGGSSGDGNRWLGDIDEVATYNDALTLQRVQTHYNAATGYRYGLPQGATLGVMLNYDAGLDRDGNNQWEDVVGTRPNGAGVNQFDWDLSAGTNDVVRTPVTSKTLPAVTHAYHFDGQARAATRAYEDIAGNPTNESASFEIAFRPGDYLGREFVFETGGATNGAVMYLDENMFRFELKNGSIEAKAAFDLNNAPHLMDDFIHAIGVVDVDADELLLYIQGNLVDVAEATGDLVKWTGGNDGGLGLHAGNAAFNLQNTVGFYEGDIALLRIYNHALSGTEVAGNFNALVPEPATLALLGLAAAGLGGYLRRRRKA